MSALANTPTNTNFLSPLGFKFQIKKAPHVNFFVQAAALPSLSLGEANVPTPFVRIPYAGDHLDFGTFDITFKIDEKMESYLEIYNWMIQIGKPETFQQYAAIDGQEQGFGVYSDLTLTVLSSAMRPLHEITYIDAFPIQLTEVMFDTRSQDVEYVEATASFRYRNFTITSL